ncbi:MAG TPA: fibronectin type III domain-containing protein, partial [Solirubrobacteraceae bacterium]|nr:fibronectin type III domain-containing protein [Solirubrobacteraceae bacterium]
GRTITFAMRMFDSVRFDVEGGSGPNVGLREIEVDAVPTPPDAPSGVEATAGPGEATVTWEPPPFDGGAPITGYVVTPYRDGVALDPVRVGEDAAAAEIPDLSPGVPHRFTVAATNLAGTGPESPPTPAVTPTS